MIWLLIGCSDTTISSTDEVPQVSILRPADGGLFLPGDPLEFCAQVSDEVGVDGVELTLSSSVDGVLELQRADCDGGNVSASLVLSDADHTLTLSAVDPREQFGMAQVSVMATENTPPWCQLDQPIEGSAIEVGQAVQVQGLIGDDESDAAALTVALSSDLEGEVWTGPTSSDGVVDTSWTPVETDEHQLSLRVTDPRGLASVCRVSLYVDPCLDQDEDGWTTCEGDCDDLDPDSHPDGVEAPDGADNDCDGDTDEGTVLGDDDQDGFTEVEGDCDDANAEVNPDATEVPYDGIDNDCADGDATDLDGDGYDGGSGPDCDDGDAAVNPGEVEVWYDGVDADCDGASDYDADGDGHDSDAHSGDDCDDTNGAVSPSATEAWYDGVDGDCDGSSDYDADADNYDHDGYGGSDCNDADASVNPGATEVWYDGVDGDCDGASDYDADADSYLSDSYGGSDCDDGDAAVNPGEPEVWYDGVDADCDGASDYDADEDGYDSDSYAGTDCDDDDDTINPGETEVWYDGVDTDCDGASDYDADEDGEDSIDYSGADCDDTDNTVYSTATETRDGVDNDCDDDCDEGLLSTGDLIVTEVMKDPSKVSDDYGEWFEVYNTTSTDIRICAAWLFEDADGDSFALSSGSTVYVAAGGYAVLGRSASSNGGVTVDYAYATGFRLANGADEVILVHDGTEIDRVEYDNGVNWPDSPGSSLNLDPGSFDSSSNDDGANWCHGSTTYGSGDKGTPGAANDGC